MSANWQARLRDHVFFQSPSGLEFTPGWAGDKETLEKRVGQYSYPNVNGTKTQDMGTEGEVYPITVYFEGDSNDSDSHDFLQAFKEKGPWTVIHPVDGELTLQPIGTIEREIDPVNSGNLTKITTTWIVPIEGEGKSSPNLAADVDDASAALDDAASASAALQAIQDTAGEIAAISDTVKKDIAIIKSSIVAIDSRINQIVATADELIAESTIDIAEIAGCLTSLLETSGLYSNTAKLQLTALASLGADIIAELPVAADTLSISDRNAVVIDELVVNTIISAMAQTATSSVPDTRSDTLIELETITDFIDTAVAAFDSMAEKTADSNLEDQYMGGRATVDAIEALRSTVTSYLLTIIFDLKTEHWFTLKRPRSPMEIAITEYGATPDTFEKYYNLVCKSNDLHGLDMLKLPAGKEIVVYV